MPTLNDVYSRHAHYLEQYKNGVANKFAPYLKRVAKELRNELLKTNTVIGEARIKQKLVFIESMVEKIYSEYTDELLKELRSFTESEVAFSSKAISSAIKHQVTLAIPSTSQVYSAIMSRPFNTTLLKDSLNIFKKEQAKVIKNLISIGFFEGNTTQQIVKSVVGTGSIGYTDGVINVSRVAANRITRTAISHASSVAKNKFFEENKRLIPYYEWVSTLDSRTSNICKVRDGLVYKVDKGQLPPAHPHCRSTIIPLIIGSVKENSKGELVYVGDANLKDSINGQVSSKLNYSDWLKKQSKDFQIEVLGKARAELFRNGKLSIDKFINDNGKTLTLAELKQKYPTALGNN